MENASKALIIAGAILLSILIISLGIIVYNQAKSTVGNVNLSEHEIATFNQKFETYEGANVSGTTVNNLLNAVVTSNTAAIRDNTGAFVTIKFPTISSSVDDNYLVMGVGFTTTGQPEQRFSSASATGLQAETAPADIATALPYPVTAANTTTSCNIKVQPGLTYRVTMSKDVQSGLINRINVESRDDI